MQTSMRSNVFIMVNYYCDLHQCVLHVLNYLVRKCHRTTPTLSDCVAHQHILWSLFVVCLHSQDVLVQRGIDLGYNFCRIWILWFYHFIIFMFYLKRDRQFFYKLHCTFKKNLDLIIPSKNLCSMLIFSLNVSGKW